MRNRANWVIGLNIVGAVLVFVAVVALFGPVSTSLGNCGSVAMPGNDEDTRTAQACDAARARRAEVARLAGAPGAVLVAAAFVVRATKRPKKPTGTAA